MINIIKKQEELIKILLNTANQTKRSSEIIAALNALDNTNEMQEYFYKTAHIEQEIGQRILRMYGLLQGLFVAIDALYSLAFTITGSKSFININQNALLKEIKYIRNDVIGHPVRRYDNKGGIAHCLVPKNLIGDNEFQYEIITRKKEIRKVNLLDCLKDYYQVANALLAYMWLALAKEFPTDGKLRHLLLEAKNRFVTKGIIDLDVVKEKYYTDYKTKDITHSRFLWRIDVIEKLKAYKEAYPFALDYYTFAILKEIDKCLGILDNQEGKKASKFRYDSAPMLFNELKEFMRKKDNDTAKIIADINHPYWDNEIDKLSTFAITDNLKAFIAMTKELKKLNQGQVVYGLWSIL